MSIANEITNYANGLGDAYGAVNDMGGIIPQDKNMNNLDTAIRTIPQSTGPTYTAGNGIDITNDVISIDDTVVAELTDIPGVMIGATPSAPGVGGTVPAPAAGDDTKFLSGDGTWQTIGKGVTVFNTEQHLRESQFQHLIYKDYARTIPAYTEDIYNAAVNGGAILFCDDRGADESESFYITAYYDPDDSYYEIKAVSGTECYSLSETSYHSGAYTASYTGFKPFTGATSQHWGTSGLVPTPFSADVDKFLKGDGTWGTPTGTTYSDFTGATSSTAGAHGLVPAPASGDQEKVLHGDGTWKDTTAKLVEMSYGESNAWAKFIAAYNAGSIVYCRASSNANPATGSQTRKAFMAYVNNATNPTNVEFQYVRSQSSKTDSQQTDQVFVYTLTNASGGTWSVASRNMGPKINVSGPITKTFTSGANATVTIGADTMTGATASAAGATGVVPAPAAGEVDYVLKGNGTWGIAGQFEISVNGDLTTDSTITEVTSGGGPAAAFVRTLLDSGWTVSIHDDNNKMYIVTSASDSQVTAIDTSGNIVTITASGTSGTFNVTRKVVPIITMTSTDPGEGGQLDANNFIFVYEV